MATPEELIDQAAVRVDAYADEAATFITALKEFVANTQFNVPVKGGKSFLFSNAATTLHDEILTGRPVVPSLDYEAPTDPGEAPSDFDVREAEDIVIPNFAETPPEIDIPQRPSLDIPSEPTAPSIKSITVPDSPDVELPTLPNLIDIEFPDAPTLQLPRFEQTFPVEPELTLSQTEFSYSEPEYSNDVLDGVEAVLLSDINNGEFGITPDDEEALYDRQKDREIKLYLQREGEILDAFSAKGHLLPTGTVVNLLESNKQDTMAKISDVNREVSVNRAELLRRGREFAIQQGLSLNELLLRDFGFKQERALQAQRFTAEFAIQVLDAKIRRYNARIQAYAAYTSAYSEQLRAELARVEIFRAEIDAARAKQEANTQQIQIYTAQIEAANSIIQLYEAQMRAANLEAEIERNKIEIFRSEIQAFLGKVQARSAQVDLYNTAIRGELAKSEIYQSQVSAYDSQVRAAATRSEVQNRNVETDIRKAELEFRTYAAKVEKYRADAETELGRLNTLISQAQIDTDLFKSVLSGLEAVLSADNQLKDLFVRTVQEDTKLDQEATRLQIQQVIEEAKVKLAATETGTQVFNQLVASAQDTLNVLASVEE
ncbi:MAG: hypothetical protein WD355_02275 [Balneolaceae bacterium]